MYYKTRSHFSLTDFQFIAGALGSSSAEREAILRLSDDPEIVTEMLHNRELIRTMLTNPGMVISVSPSLYFYVLISQALEHKQLADDDMADYISEMCVDFTESDAFWLYQSDASGQMLYFVDLARVVQDYNHVRQYQLHRYIGNAALFLTGFFPDLIYNRERQKGAPSIDYYESMGCAHFDAAASASFQFERSATPVLYKLSEYFTEVRSAINLYVDAYMNLHNPSAGIERIERQSATLDEESFKKSLLL